MQSLLCSGASTINVHWLIIPSCHFIIPFNSGCTFLLGKKMMISQSFSPQAKTWLARQLNQKCKQNVFCILPDLHCVILPLFHFKNPIWTIWCASSRCCMLNSERLLKTDNTGCQLCWCGSLKLGMIFCRLINNVLKSKKLRIQQNNHLCDAGRFGVEHHWHASVHCMWDHWSLDGFQTQLNRIHDARKWNCA